jgi:hypothetical protein
LLSRGVWLALLAGVLALGGLLALVLWRPVAAFAYAARHADPALKLWGTAGGRTLTDDEYERAVGYLSAPHPRIRLVGLGIVGAVADLDPDRRADAMSRITALTADPDLGAAAATLLTKLNLPKGPPDAR